MAMSGVWRTWFALWCLSIGGFGVLLAGGAFAATDGPVRLLMTVLQGGGDVDFAPALRFSLAVMGAVTIGWAVTLHVMIRAAIALGSAGRPLWTAVSAGMASWFVIDCTLSVATGFGLNIIPNLLLVTIYVAGLIGSGVLKSSA
jgi:hypothetical protein